jgi:hypothetical protein
MDSGNIGKDIVESPYILGKLYRGVDCKNYYKECLKSDHERSVELNYSFNRFILGNPKKKVESEKDVPDWFEYLDEAFTDLVNPMIEEIKKIMVYYKILNEGELYCTNLNFNLDDDKFSKIIGDPGQKDEDAVKALNQKLK